MPRIFCFGIDGGSYQLLESFMEQGLLPCFSNLIKKGAIGKFISTIPPHTAPGWVSILTGVEPGAHGIYQFWKTQGLDYIGMFNSSKDWSAVPLWKILNAYGLKTGMVNIPMTHPPSEVDGFMLSWPLTKTLNYSYPKGLLNEIVQAGGHFHPDLFVMYTGQEDYLQTACKITEKRVQTIKYLVDQKEWDFLMTVFPEVDRISHYYWHYMDPISPEYVADATPGQKDAIAAIYKAVDKALSEIISFLPEDTLLVVLSDHGFRVGQINFNVQTFLYEKGYLSLKLMDQNLVLEEHNGLNPENTDGDWFHVKDRGQHFEVDWSKTKAFIAAPGSYGININLKGRQSQGIVDVEDFESIRQELINELSFVKHPEKGTLLFKKVVPSSEAYNGKMQSEAPDIILIPEDYGTMVSHKLVLDKWFSMPDQKGMHCRDGIMLFHGEEVLKGKRLEPNELVDFVPTVLKYFGIKCPNSIEGKCIPVFKESFEPEFKPEIGFDEIAGCSELCMKSSYYSQEEKKEIENRLISLGYL